MTQADSPRIFVPPPLMFAGTLVAALAVEGKIGAIRFEGDWAEWLGIAVMLGGLLLIGAALGLFQLMGTRAEPWKPAGALVTIGIYRITRNPMYLGMAAAYLGAALFLHSLLAGLLLAPLIAIMDRIVISREEAYLARRFGEDYAAYRRRVRRWL